MKFTAGLGALLIASTCAATPVSQASERGLVASNDGPAELLSDAALGIEGNGQELKIVSAEEGTDAGGYPVSRLVRRQNRSWSSHAKYYAFGGRRGTELYMKGTWSNPVLSVGQNSGTCEGTPLGMGTPMNPSTVANKSCSCSIVQVGPFGFTSRCNMRWMESDNDGEFTLALNLAFDCGAYFSCTGTNAYKINAKQSNCRDLQNKGHCTGFRVTP
ncbi:Hypothetical protein D9617_36g063060 [Elsinoe fawcettii]|nr:Hypothetical protein D9617_36g063060 [Elsinoe fawcettii]